MKRHTKKFCLVGKLKHSAYTQDRIYL